MTIKRTDIYYNSGADTFFLYFISVKISLNLSNGEAFKMPNLSTGMKDIKTE